MYRHIIPKGILHNQHKAQVIADLMKLEDNVAHLIQFKQYRKKRSTEQNAFLHAVPLKLICEHTGMDIEPVKRELMGRAFGFEEVVVFGRRQSIPLKTTSELNTAEFSFFMDFCEMFAAQEWGLIIPKPNEYLLESDT